MREYFSNIYTGLLSFWEGMSLTFKHLKGKKDLVATLQYPNEKWPVPERNIGFNHSEYNVIRSRLHVDIDDCIGCLQCERACPVDCIKIDTLKPPKGSDYDCGTTAFGTQKKMIVPRFTIDMSECMYCNLCVYPCPEECIYMVGGPNQEKHDIDYEFSKYSRDGLIFEFSDSTDQDIVDIGGADYLEKRKQKDKKIEDGKALKGVPPVSEGASISDDNTKKTEITGNPEALNIKSFNQISDKMLRGTAKKVFLSETKSGASPKDALDKVIKKLSENGTVDADTASILDSLKNLKDVPVETSTDTSISAKSFNSLEDKMQRGLAKKIFIQETKKGTSPIEIIEIIRSEAKNSSAESDQLADLLDSLNKIASSSSPKSDTEVAVKSLFDIKLLNGIEDKMCRGIAKKVYIKGKKEKSSSSEILDAIVLELEKNEKSPSDFDEIFKSIREGLE